MNIFKPFSLASGKLKFLIMAINYLTKWVPAEALEKIDAANILKFFKVNILSRYEIPQYIVTNNMTCVNI